MLQARNPNRWFILLIGGLFFLYEFFQINMFNALEGPLSLEFQVSAGELGKLSAAYFYGTIILLFPAGLILDKFSTRHVILFAMVMTILGTLFFSYATSIEMAAIGRFSVGLCAGPFALISVIKLATRWFTAKELSLVAGIAIALGMLGGVLAQVPFHLLVESVGWREALHVNVWAGVAMLILIYAYVQDSPEGHEEAAPAEHRSFGQRVHLVLSSLYNWKVGIYASLTNLPIFLLGSLFSTLYLTQQHGLTALQASYAAMMLFVGMLLGSPLFGWISGKMRKRREPMMFGGALALASIAAVMLLPLTFSPIVALFFLLGLGASAHTLVYSSIAENNPRSVTGSAEGLAGVLIMGGGAFFQPLFGHLLDSRWDGSMVNGLPSYGHESFQMAISIIPICLFIGIALIFFSKETYCDTPMH